jgi:hypothetical protein
MEKMKQEIIAREKERLLKENMPYLEGFMPKGILQGHSKTRT